MTVSLKHQFVSNVADSPDATLVQPSNWNAEHLLTANADSLLGAVTTGNVVEITCTSAGRALLDDADASAQRTTLGLGSIATQNANNVSITGGSVSGITDLAIADGGTGASDASTARTNLGIGTIGTQNSNNVSITGGSITGITDLAVADGGTGASDASTARTNLGIGTMGTQNANNVSITGGSISGITDLALADGGTGASDAATARTNLGSAASGDVTSSGITMATSRLLGRTTANTGAIEEISVAGTLTLSGGTLTGSSFPAGTVMLFKQSAAPTGWTKITTDNDKALRIVSGNVTTGGTVAFTTAFASQTPSGNISNTTATGNLSNTTATGNLSNTTATGTVGDTTLATNQIPSHLHGMAYSIVAKGTGTNNVIQTLGNGASNADSKNAGGGLAHAHSFTGDAHTHLFTGTAHNHNFTGDAHSHTFTGNAINLAVQYVDVIAASKD